MIDEMMATATTATTPEDALEKAVATYLAAAVEIDRFQTLQAQAKLLIAEIFLETGQTSAVTPSGNIATSKASVTVTYDAKAIDVLLRDDLRDADAQLTHLESDNARLKQDLASLEAEVTAIDTALIQSKADNARLKQELATVRSFAVARSDDAWKNAVQAARTNNPYALSAFTPVSYAEWRRLQYLVGNSLDRYSAAMMEKAWDACASAIEEMAIESEAQP